MLYNITSNVKVTNTHPDWSKQTRRRLATNRIFPFSSSTRYHRIPSLARNS